MFVLMHVELTLYRVFLVFHVNPFSFRVHIIYRLCTVWGFVFDETYDIVFHRNFLSLLLTCKFYCACQPCRMSRSFILLYSYDTNKFYQTFLESTFVFLFISAVR